MFLVLLEHGLPIGISVLTLVMGWWRFRHTARKEAVDEDRSKVVDLRNEVADLQRRQGLCEENLKRCEAMRLTLTEEKLLLMQLVMKARLEREGDD